MLEKYAYNFFSKTKKYLQKIKFKTSYLNPILRNNQEMEFFSVEEKITQHFQYRKTVIPSLL